MGMWECGNEGMCAKQKLAQDLAQYKRGGEIYKTICLWPMVAFWNDKCGNVGMGIVDYLCHRKLFVVMIPYRHKGRRASNDIFDIRNNRRAIH